MKLPIGVRFAVLVALASIASACSKSCASAKQPGVDTGRFVSGEAPPPAPEIALTPGADAKDLSIAAARPIGVLLGQNRPTVTFNKPVVALATLEQGDQRDSSMGLRIAPEVAGSWRWLGSASVEFIPAAQLPYSTEFAVTVPRGLQALDGSALAEDYTFRFHTALVEVQSWATEPSETACRWSTPDQLFKVKVNQPLAASEEAFFFALPDGSRVNAHVVKAVNVQDEQQALEAAEQDARRQRHVERMPPAELTFKNQQTRYELVPTKPLPANAPFVLALDVAAKAAQGPLALEQHFKHSCSTFGPMRVVEARRCVWGTSCTRGPPGIVFTNPVGPIAGLKQRLTLEPGVPIDWALDADDENLGAERFDQDTGIAVPARLKPGTRYTLKLEAGVPDRFGQAAPAFQATFTTDDLQPTIFLGTERALLELSGDGKLPAQVTNLTSISAELWELSPQQYAAMRFCRGEACTAFPARAPDAQLRDALTYPKNEPRLHALELRPALKGKTSGLVLARILAPGTSTDRQPLRVLAQITDLAAHAKVGLTSGVVWVTSVSKGTPLANAKVSVFDRRGMLMHEGTTDAQGLAELPGLMKLDPERKDHDWEEPQVLVAASLGGDLGVATTHWSDQAHGNNGSTAFDGLVETPLGLLFTDRGLYRPGDTVHVKGILRRKSATSPTGLITMEEGTAIQVETKGPEGRVIDKRTVKLSRFGTFSFDQVIPKEGRLGTYDLYAMQIDRKPSGPWYGSFRMAEYRAPTFRVDVLAGTPSITAGEPLTASVSARYLFGGAMAGAQASWSATRVTTAFSPPRHEDYSFGKQTWSYDEEEPPQDSSFVGSGKALIEKSGSVKLDVGKVDAPGDKPASVTIEAEVMDVSRQTQAGRVGVLVHPASFYLGLGKQSLFIDAGKSLKMPIVAVEPSGKRVPGVAVKLSALSRAWHSVKKKGPGGVFQHVTEAVDTEVSGCEIKTAADVVNCDLKLEKAGYFTLQALAKDPAGRTALSTTGVYVIGPGFTSWQREDSAKVELVPDKQGYDVGDVAKVLIKSPYPEATALVTIEREGVFEKRLVKLQGTATAIEVPVTEAMVPNIYVGALLVRPRIQKDGMEPGDDPGRPSMRLGFAELKVGTNVKRLAVSVKASKEEYRPREKVPVSIEVKDSKGKPTKAEVTVYAVDEGVLRLSGYTVPDPLADMYPHRSLGVALGEPLLSLVRRQKFGEKGELQPGGGGGREGGADVRGKFLTTVLWKTVETNTDGKAAFTFELPDNLTTFRLMAVALTEEDRFGSGQTELRVSLPLLVLPALPRFARTGDAFEAGVVVNAKGLAKERSEVTVSAEVSGTVGLDQGQSAQQKVTVEEGVAREVRFRFKALAAGPTKFVFRASAAGEPGQGGPFKDAVEQTIPVQLPVALEAVATYGDTDGKRTEGLLPPGDVRPDLGGLTVTLSSTALGSLGDAMEQLLDYPYGCLEQLSSRLVPFVAVREVEKVFGLAAGKNEASAAKARELDKILADLTGRGPQDAPRDADAVVRQTISKIEELQQPSGGFRYWPGEGCTYAWPSIYATLALHRAHESGYEVKKSVLDAAKRFLAQKAEGKASCPWEQVGAETRIFSLQVLARMGEPRPAYYDELYAQKDKLPLFAKALLADAIAVGKGKRPQADALLQELLNQAQETPAGVHFEEVKAGSYAPLFSSDTRTTGMALQTLVDLKPTHPFVGKIARYLTNVRRGGGYRNTQEAAYALMGLTEVVRVRERAAPDFIARVTLAGKELFAQTFKGRSLSVVTKKVSMSELLASTADKPGGSALPFEFTRTGTGLLTYGALLKYAPRELPTKARDEGLFVQRWLEAFDAPGKVATTFAAGELVRVRLRVATRMERAFVAVEVPLPAGLEAVDLQLATTARLPSEAHEEAREEGGLDSYDADTSYTSGFYSPFIWSEKRDDKVTYFADQLPPGVHVQSFVARATTPGQFLLKPAMAQEMYAPEVFGRSEAGMVTVTANRPVAQR